MADVNIAAFDGTTDNGNIQNPARGTALVVGVSGIAVGAADVGIIAAEWNDDIEIFTVGAATVTVQAGDYPASPLSAKGADTYTSGATATRYVPEKGRHVHDDGAIRITTSAAITVWVCRMRGNFLAVEPVNQVTIPAAPA